MLVCFTKKKNISKNIGSWSFIYQIKNEKLFEKLFEIYACNLD